MSIKKEIPKCGKCALFNRSKKECSVVVILEGEKVHLPVDENDPCFFETPFFNEDTGKWETLNYIKQIRCWVEDSNGCVIDGTKENGKVKIEYS